MSKARDIASGAPAPAGVSTTELGYVDGVTSAIQTQLNQKPEVVAGKNKIINGDFGIWQRGTSFSNPANGAYVADRWMAVYDGTITSHTISQQAFTPGTAPVAGYEGQYFLRWALTTNGTSTFRLFQQRIEDVRTFAGQTIAISFWIKASSTATIVGAAFGQAFGTGGSTGVETYPTLSTTSITTSWQRITATINVPSISGKTIGTGHLSYFYLNLPTSNTFDIWGVQLEAGSTATAFQTATGTVQGELAACQRYYQKTNNQSEAPGTAPTSTPTNAINASTTLVVGVLPFKVSMRTAPTVTLYSTVTGTSGKIRSGGADITATTADVGENSIGYISATGLTAGSNSTIAYTASAEL